MESIRKKEIAIHVILTAALLALFGIWYGDTLSKAPHRLQEKGLPSYVEEGHRPPGPGPGIGNPGDREGIQGAEEGRETKYFYRNYITKSM